MKVRQKNTGAAAAAETVVSVLSGPHPATRRERKKERTRREIYEAAMRLFVDASYDEVTVGAICREADVARTTFFAHFPAKSALLLEYSHGIAARFLLALQAAETSAVEQLSTLSTLVMESWFEHADVMSAMLLEISIPAAEPFEPDSGDVSLHRLVTDIIEHGIASGELRPGIAPELAAAAFLNMGAIVLASGAARHNEKSPDALRNEFLDFALHGLRGGVAEIEPNASE